MKGSHGIIVLSSSSNENEDKTTVKEHRQKVYVVYMLGRDSLFSSPTSDNTNYSHNLQREEGKQYKIFTYKQFIFCIMVPLTNICLL